MRNRPAATIALSLACAATAPSLAHAADPAALGYDIEVLTDPILDAPRGLVLDADGNAYTFEHFSGEVLKIAHDGATLQHFADMGGDTWTGAAYDASTDTLYFDKYVAGTISAVDASGTATTAVSGLISEGTGGIASNGHGLLYVTQWDGPSSNCPADVLQIDMTTVPPTTTTYASQQVCYPDGPAVAPDGTVYVAERGGRLIRRIATDASHTTTVLIDDFNFPLNVSVTPSGDLLVPDAGDGTIYRIDPANPQKNVLGTGFGEVYTAVEDADGRIYVASMDLNAIFRLTPSTGDLCASAANGTPCNDERMCLTSDSCQAGACVGHDEGACTPLASFTVDEGTTHLFSGSVDAPPGTNPSYAWTFGNATSAVGWTASYAYPDNGTFTVMFTASSSSGNAADSATVTVKNVAPTITSTPANEARESQAYTYTLAFTDPGTADTHTCSAPTRPAGSQLVGCQLVWTPDYKQAIGGAAPIRMCVTDDDGGQTCQDVSVTVKFLDLDGDNLPDGWEISNFGDITSFDDDSDPDADGMTNLQEFTHVTDPLTYDGPNAPTPSAPTCGNEVASLQPTLVVNNAVDPQGTPLTYQFQIFSNRELTSLVAETAANALVAQGAGATTAWPSPVTLVENTRYYWRARASDQFTYGPWSEPECTFFVNAVNSAPTAPRINSPAFGAAVDSLTPTLKVDNATDPDDVTLTYVFEVYADAGLVTRLAATPVEGVAEGGAGTTSWQVANASPALQAGATYYWHARARDPDNDVSAWSATGEFITPAANQPPVANDDGATVEVGKSVTIDVAANDSDPENKLDLGSITVVEAGSLGTHTVKSDGTVTYTAGTTAGEDTFTYSIKDAAGAVSNEATVRITVTADAGVCGDGVVNGNEECEDNNHANDDGCSACHVERGWTCDVDSCRPQHGDGIVVGEEECDDGNDVSGDGCSATGVVEDLWTCAGEPSECEKARPGGEVGCSSGPLGSGADASTLVIVGLAVAALGRRALRRRVR